LIADDEDDVYFLLSGILAFVRSGQESRDFMTLAPSYDPYLSKPDLLSSHIRIYHFFLATIPLSVLGHVTPLALLSVITRDSHNSFSIRDAGSESDYTTTEFLGYGTWSLASFYNHGCEPNVAKQRRGRSMTFWTSRDIERGEELTLSYLGGEENLKETVDERAEKLRVGWGFVCGCARCQREWPGRLEDSAVVNIDK
jgi:SET domain